MENKDILDDQQSVNTQQPDNLTIDPTSQDELTTDEAVTVNGGRSRN